MSSTSTTSRTHGIADPPGGGLDRDREVIVQPTRVVPAAPAGPDHVRARGRYALAFIKALALKQVDLLASRLAA